MRGHTKCRFSRGAYNGKYGTKIKNMFGEGNYCITIIICQNTRDSLILLVDSCIVIVKKPVLNFQQN